MDINEFFERRYALLSIGFVRYIVDKVSQRPISILILTKESITQEEALFKRPKKLKKDNFLGL